MSFVKTVSPAEAEGDVLAMYERQKAAFGFVQNYARVFCHRLEVMERWGRLLAAIRHPLSARRFELITFAASQALRNSYCSLAHGKALANYLGYEDLNAIVTGGSDGALTDAERTMMFFARMVAVDASQVTAEDTDRLKAHGFTDEEIFDIAATAAARSFFTKVLDGLGVLTDSAYGDIDDNLKDSLIVGRPIDTKVVESLLLT